MIMNKFKKRQAKALQTRCLALKKLYVDISHDATAVDYRLAVYRRDNVVNTVRRSSGATFTTITCFCETWSSL